MRNFGKIAKPLALVALAVAAAALIVGCAEGRHATIPGLAVPPQVELKGLERNQYEIMTTAKGEGCATFVGLFPIPIFWIDAENIRADIYGFRPGSIAREIAVYKAIQSVPDADALFWPRFNDRIETGGIWYYKVCSTVIGKTIRFKTDGAAPQAQQTTGYPPQPQYAPAPAQPQYAPPPAAPVYQPMQYPPPGQK